MFALVAALAAGLLLAVGSASADSTVASKQAQAQAIMDQVLADYITASTPISPFVLSAPTGRINCADSNGATAPNCPAILP